MHLWSSPGLADPEVPRGVRAQVPLTAAGLAATVTKPGPAAVTKPGDSLAAEDSQPLMVAGMATAAQEVAATAAGVEATVGAAAVVVVVVVVVMARAAGLALP